MKVTVFKCEICGELFEKADDYNVHSQKEKALQEIERIFPAVKDKTCDFANGHYSVQRTQGFLETYKALIFGFIKEFKQADKYEPMSYGWFRCLNDGNSMFYGVAMRILNICPVCFKEWGQQYYANHCCKS